MNKKDRCCAGMTYCDHFHIDWTAIWVTISDKGTPVEPGNVSLAESCLQIMSHVCMWTGRINLTNVPGEVLIKPYKFRHLHSTIFAKSNNFPWSGGRFDLTHLPWTKWSPSRWRYFQMHFREWKFCIVLKSSVMLGVRGGGGGWGGGWGGG